MCRARLLPRRRTAGIGAGEGDEAEILEARAWDLVREHGLAALALRDLAARVGMRAPSLYQYFDSKHAIYDAMFAPRLAAGARRDRVRRRQDRAAWRRCRSRPGACSRSRRATQPATNCCSANHPGLRAVTGVVRAGRRDVHVYQGPIRGLGITDPDAMDLWTALISGLTSQQLSNDPGGDRWERLIDRTVDMYLAQVKPASPARKRKAAK